MRQGNDTTASLVMMVAEDTMAPMNSNNDNNSSITSNGSQMEEGDPWVSSTAAPPPLQPFSTTSNLIHDPTYDPLYDTAPHDALNDTVPHDALCDTTPHQHPTAAKQYIPQSPWEATLTKPHQPQYVLQEMSYPAEHGLLVEMTPFVECHDVIGVTLSFLDLESIQNTRQVCRRWNFAAQEKIQSREKEVISFVARHNDEVEVQYNLKASVTQGSKLRFLVCSVAALPACLLSWAVLIAHQEHVLGQKSPGGSFSFFAGVVWAIVATVFYIAVHTFASLRFYKSQKVLSLGGAQTFALAFYHIVNTCSFVCWFSVYAWFNTSSQTEEEFWISGASENHHLPKFLMVPAIFMYFAPFLYIFSSAAGLVSWVDGAISIHVKQIRNPIHLQMSEEGQESAIELGRGVIGGFFEQRRRVVSLAQMEQMMAAAATEDAKKANGDDDLGDGGATAVMITPATTHP